MVRTSIPATDKPAPAGRISLGEILPPSRSEGRSPSLRHPGAFLHIPRAGHKNARPVCLSNRARRACATPGCWFENVPRGSGRFPRGSENSGGCLAFAQSSGRPLRERPHSIISVLFSINRFTLPAPFYLRRGYRKQACPQYPQEHR
jgi:hypothetical protein